MALTCHFATLYQTSSHSSHHAASADHHERDNRPSKRHLRHLDYSFPLCCSYYGGTMQESESQRISIVPLDPEIYPALLSSPSSSRATPARPRSAASLPLLSTDLHTLPPPDHTHPCCPPAPVYVLAADGSRVYLLNAEPVVEDPPPYAPFSLHGRARAATFAGPLHVSRTGHGSSLPGLPTGPSSPPPPRQYGTFDSREGEEPARSLGSMLRSIVCGDGEGTIALSEGEGEVVRRSAWRRYWAPVVSRDHWRPLLHLLAINVPFNLLVWPPLLVGTLAGTVLLITLPIGAVVWWLTLMIARWAAREELRLQARFHGLGHRPRPVFHRVREVRLPSSGGDGQLELVYDTRFLKKSWAMVCTPRNAADPVLRPLLVRRACVLAPHQARHDTRAYDSPARPLARVCCATTLPPDLSACGARIRARTGGRRRR